MEPYSVVVVRRHERARSWIRRTAMSQQKQQTPREQKEIDWKALAGSTGPYPVEAFHFVREGLSYAAHRVHEDIASVAEADRHITGQQLCLGLRDFAIDRYGMLAPAVLGHWNIRRTEDFGRIVFNLVEAGEMGKTDQDDIKDFAAGYDFDQAFPPETGDVRVEPEDEDDD